MGRTYNRMLQLLVLPGLQDTQCGFKLFTGEAAVACFGPLRTAGFGFDAEVLQRARRLGWTIAEVGVVWRHAENSRVSPLRDFVGTLLDLHQAPTASRLTWRGLGVTRRRRSRRARAGPARRARPAEAWLAGHPGTLLAFSCCAHGV